MVRALSVTSVQLLLQKSNPPKLVVLEAGKVGTPGWRNISLERLEDKVSDAGILDLELVGTPPTGIVPQVVTDIAADLVIEDEVERIVGVAVHARTGVVTQLREGSGAAAGTAAFASAAGIGGSDRLTTLAIGEETQFPKLAWEKQPFGPAEKFPIGEKLALGEKLPLETQAMIGGESGPLTLEKNPFNDLSVGERSFPAEELSLNDALIRISPFQTFRRG